MRAHTHTATGEGEGVNRGSGEEGAHPHCNGEGGGVNRGGGEGGGGEPDEAEEDACEGAQPHTHTET